LKRQQRYTQVLLDEMNQYKRCNTVEVYGILEEANEDTHEIMKNVGYALDVDIQREMTYVFHQLRKPPHQSSSVIIVKSVR
jgi:hypothetical protein